MPDKNNPMNVRATGIKWLGECTRPGDAFERFDTEMNGIRAGCRILVNYRKLHGITTVEGIVPRYAPASDHNDVERYVHNLRRLLGVQPYEEINVLDLATLERLAAAIALLETGRRIAGPALVAACKAALGL